MDHSLKEYILPGHGSVLQSEVWLESPEQSAPPLRGGGFVQLRVLDFDEVPQVELHVLYVLQADHSPSTEGSEMIYVKIFICVMKIL